MLWNRLETDSTSSAQGISNDQNNALSIGKDTNSSGNSNTHFRFIGERGARNTDTTATRDESGVSIQMTPNLTKVLWDAQAMEKNGKTPREIKYATGWEKDSDGGPAHHKVYYRQLYSCQ